MTHSMTAYAKKQIKADWGQATWELRSVNHRYCDVSFKIQDAFREWELPWRDMVNKVLHRGKIECSLSFKPGSTTLPQLEINLDLVDKLKLATKEVALHLPVNSDWNIRDVLQWPNVLLSPSGPSESLLAPLSALLEQALGEFVESRAREGLALHQLIENRLVQVVIEINKIKAYLPEIVTLHREKLIKRLNDAQLKEAFEPNRLEQEMVYFMQRSDITEELDRLEAHVAEVTRVLKVGDNIGRRLDFLMQEMNREANTLASKSCHPVMTQGGVELKVLIEQMREQIQNVE